MKRYFTLLAFLLIALCTLAQNKPNCYRIYLTDKNNTPFSIDKPNEFLSERAIAKRARFNIAITEEDLPVNTTYIQKICSYGEKTQLLSQSKWTNTITIYCPSSKALNLISRLPFVKKFEPVATYDLEHLNPYSFKESKEPNISKGVNDRDLTDSLTEYGKSYGQIAMHHGDLLHEAGFKGKGMLIAVIDGGWLNFNKDPLFKPLYENGQIIGEIDLLPGVNDIYGNSPLDENHGALITSIMATNYPDSMIGTAPEANYLFIRSENPWTEYPIEEDFWMNAAELADSAGADVISSSLGYHKYEDTVNYPMTYEYCDGNSLMSQVATKAVSKGIIVCNSAGNSGEDAWRHITIPADARDILTVGAIALDSSLASFSSVGPSYDGRIKPDVVAVGYQTLAIYSSEINHYLLNVDGTSAACPVIAGLAACLWQALPTRTAYELMDIIRKSSNHYNAPDNSYGYGIPDVYAAYLKYLSGISQYVLPENQITVYPNPCQEQCTVATTAPLHHVQINIFNMNGQLVHQYNNLDLTSETKLNISNCKSGVYLLQISGFDEEGNRFNDFKKVVKQ